MHIHNLQALAEDIRKRVDLVEFISRDVTLQKRGTRIVGLCPFHNDRNPTFSILPTKPNTPQRWGCHACNVQGDLFDYVMHKEHCNLFEAIEYIVERNGIDISEHLRDATEHETALAAQFAQTQYMAQSFHNLLMSNSAALFDLYERGLTDETLRRFLIGYCPSVEMASFFFGEAALRLVEPNVQNWQNIFGGHVLIPQCTASGKVWGWYSKRKDSKPKYVCTSSTAPLYDPYSRLYAFHIAKKTARSSGLRMVLVEGFFDAMMCAQHDIPAVAICGTSLTEDHLRALDDHKITQAVMVLDGDTAGKKAMEDVAAKEHEFKSLGMRYGIVPGDPDEYLDTYGRDAFLQICESAPCAVEFVVGNATRGVQDDATSRLDAYESVVRFLSKLPRHGIACTDGIRALGRALDINPDGIEDDLDKLTEMPMASHIAELAVIAEFACGVDPFGRFPELRAQHFSFILHTKLFGLMYELFHSGATINLDLLLNEIRNKRMGEKYTQLVLSLPDRQRENIERYVEEIIDKALRRSMSREMRRAMGIIQDGDTALVGSITATIESMTRMLTGETRKQILIGNVKAADMAVQIFEDRARSGNPIIGLDLGPAWARLMSWTKGIRNAFVYLIAALSGVGKSIVLMNFVYHLAMSVTGPRAKGLVVSMEMSEQQNIARLLAMHTGLPYDFIDTGRMETQEQLDKLAQGFADFREAGLSWMTGTHSVSEIAIQARMLKAQDKLDFIVIDYIQLLDISGYAGNMNEVTRYNTASQELHELAESLDVPIICAAQLNRAAYDQAEPSGQHMGASYKIYQDAHVCYILSDRGESGLMGKLDKNRGGPSQQVTMLDKDYRPGLATLRVYETDK